MAEEFDGLQYIASYGDLILAFGENAAAGEQHYLQFGRGERRQTDTFDEERYLANYPDLQAAFGDSGDLATLHYIRFGFGEGRNDNPPLPESFDPLQYIASHDDLIEAFGANPELGARHYVQFGGAEGRAIDTFDEQQYLINYPDLATAFHGDGAAATFHYIAFGKNEGRHDSEEGNTPPTAVDDTLTVKQDDDSTPVAVLANDSDLDAGDVLTVVGISNAGTLGSVALGHGPGVTVAYDPGDAFVGLADGEDDTDSFSYTVADDSGGESRATVTVTVTGVNDRPTITSPAGASVVENIAATGVVATDPDENPVIFTISGGDDAGLFDIDAANQELVFKKPPNFEDPGDADENNVYLVQVTAKDSAGATEIQDLKITVTDADIPDDEVIIVKSETGATALDFLT